MFEIVKHYRTDDSLRQSFNVLAQNTFGLNFENWYQNGFWTDSYDPYSVVLDGRVVANVSVNQTDMNFLGTRCRLIQLGTVMTEPQYRNQGLIRRLMQEIEMDHAGRVDGMYLFANDSVLDFYPKFGFQKAKEILYSKSVSQNTRCEMLPVPMKTREQWEKLGAAMKESGFRGAFDMVDNPGLIFFYVSQFMQDCVFYCPNLHAYAIAELEEGNLLLHNIFSPKADLEDVIKAFGCQVTQVQLGFAPDDSIGWGKELLVEEDTTLFVKGDVFTRFEEMQLRVPTLSHA